METEMRLEDVRFSMDKHPCFSEKALHARIGEEYCEKVI